jgi:hypothetical protein
VYWNAGLYHGARKIGETHSFEAPVGPGWRTCPLIFPVPPADNHGREFRLDLHMPDDDAAVAGDIIGGWTLCRAQLVAPNGYACGWRPVNVYTAEPTDWHTCLVRYLVPYWNSHGREDQALTVTLRRSA